jgi:DivIVA domain-containing protein
VERDEIERRDFPSARRGYDPAAVDEHLRRVADAATRQRPGSLAEGAATQVRAILEAAEASAQQLRDDAGREATGHVERVEHAAKGMLEQLDRLQAELDRLLAGLKSSAETLAGSLAELRREAETLGGREPTAAAEPPDAGSPTEPIDAAEPPDAGSPTEPIDAAEPPVEPSPTVSNGARSDDEAGARLVALNMALDGTPREETARFLAEHYELGDVHALLEDVYTSAGR